MIYLLRHGEDDESYIGGWSDVDLTENGIKQVKEISNYIKQNKLNINQIYTSDIKRAVSTSDIVSFEIGIIPVNTPILRELDKGLLTGLKESIAKEKYREYFDEIDIYTKYPEGESMIDLYYRIKNSLQEIISYDNSLLVTHRGVINMIYFILNNRLPDMDKKQFMVTHASLHELDVQNMKIRRLDSAKSLK